MQQTLNKDKTLKSFQIKKDVNNDEELRIKLNVILKDDEKGYKAYNMIRYILATNRSSIRQLKGDE